MPATFDLILKNGKCFVDGQLKSIDIGISNGIIKSTSKIEKISKFGKTYEDLTLDTVKKFLKDSQDSDFKI